MTTAVGAALFYILTIIVSPEKGQDVRQVFTDINTGLSDREGATFKYKLKVIGENKIVADVQVTHVCVLEDIIDSLHQVAEIETINEPVISYEEFRIQLGIPGIDLAEPFNQSLERIIYYVETFFDYYGNTTEELTAVYRESVALYLKLKNAGTLFGQDYKHVAERKLTTFSSGPGPAEFDSDFLKLRLNTLLGPNVHIRVKGVQNLEDYVACRNNTGARY
ncbi:hypothetical protein BsWGS_10318 [Bradybaena similaris]